MSRTYTATGINLKAMPLGEADRLLTVLTREHGLVQAVAPGARKTKSSLSGRSGLFVINQLFLVKGRSLDKITQAETLESYPGLAQDLRKLTTAQYLAELVLCQALSDQPQEELFNLLTAYLSILEAIPSEKNDPLAAFKVLTLLTQAAFHFLILAGIAPHVQVCCVTRSSAIPNFTDPRWRIGFSMAAGGVVSLSASSSVRIDFRLRAEELAILKRLAESHPLQLDEITLDQIRSVDGGDDPDSPGSVSSGFAWITVERVLRQYAQYQFDRPIRSSTLIDTCFAGVVPPPSSLPS